MKHQETNERDSAALALDALGWILEDRDRADRLLALTGLSPDSLRAGLDDPTLLAAILRFLEAHEPDLIACGEHLALRPEALVAARRTLES
jgi:hypothetical protein